MAICTSILSMIKHNLLITYICKTGPYAKVHKDLFFLWEW